jgi:hypothetical protein
LRTNCGLLLVGLCLYFDVTEFIQIITKNKIQKLMSRCIDNVLSINNPNSINILEIKETAETYLPV